MQSRLYVHGQKQCCQDAAAAAAAVALGRFRGSAVRVLRAESPSKPGEDRRRERHENHTAIALMRHARSWTPLDPQGLQWWLGT